MEPSQHGVLLAVAGFAQAWLAPLLAIGTSVVYFIASPTTESLSKRLLASAHGISIAVIYFAALSVHWLGEPNPDNTRVLLVSLSIPVALAIASLLLFRGRRAIHALQIFNLLSLGWTAFVGSMAVGGTWL